MFLATCTTALAGQDLIVTIQGDSLDCKVTRIRRNIFYFTFRDQGNVLSTFLPGDQIQYYQTDFYPPPDSIVKDKGYKTDFRIAVNLGWNYRLANPPDGLPLRTQQHISYMKSGFHVGLDFTQYTSEHIGQGIKTSFIKPGNSDVYIRHDTTRVIGADSLFIVDGRSDGNASLLFIGPMLSYRLTGKQGNALVVNFGAGYLGYRNEVEYDQSYKVLGRTWGFFTDVSYDLELTENLYLGIQVSLMGAKMKNPRLDNGLKSETIWLEKSHYDGLSRVDLSVGIRYRL